MAAAKRKRPTAHSASAGIRRELDIHRQELAAQNDELREANGKLATAIERYAQLYDVAPAAFFTLDGDGAIVEANLMGRELLGTPRSAIFGRNFADFVVSTLRASFRAFRSRLLSDGGRFVHDTTLAIGPRRFPVRIEATSVGAAPQAMSGCLLCVTDESDRRQREAERHSLQARLAEINRIESLGALAGAVAQDMNGILSTVLAHSDLALLSDARLAAATRQSLVQIRDAALRATELSQQMITYCGRERLASEPVDVTTLIRSMSELFAQAASEEIELVLQLGDGLPLVVADRLRLQQVILNLVINASDAISPGTGRIVLRTVVAIDAGAHGVVIECADNGRGMDSQTAHRAFDPFFTTKATARGLGLAVVHGTVRAHGGTVAVETELGKGTKVRVFLPVTREPGDVKLN